MMAPTKTAATIALFSVCCAAVSGCSDDAPDAEETGTKGVSSPVDLSRSHEGAFVVSEAVDKESLVDVVHNSVLDEFAVFWQSEPSNTDGDMNCEIMGQRIATDGRLVGEPFVISRGPKLRVVVHAVFNPKTEQYMVIWGQQRQRVDVFLTLLDAEGNQVKEPVPISDPSVDQVHTNVALNSKSGELLVTYNDSRGGDGNGDIFAIILNSEAEIVKDEFPVCSAEGNQFNPVAKYSASLDAYLMNWEDFRYVEKWTEPGNIVGALVSADGTVLAADISMVEDQGGEDEGDQRFNFIAWDSKRQRFLVTWGDTRPSWQNASIGGRFIDGEGVPIGEDFPFIDGPGAQMIAHPIYAAKRDQYLVVWERDPSDLDVHYFMDIDAELDVAAAWIDPDGEMVGSSISIAAGEVNERFAKSAYSPQSDAALIVWQADAGRSDDPTGHMTATGGDLAAVILR